MNYYSSVYLLADRHGHKTRICDVFSLTSIASRDLLKCPSDQERLTEQLKRDCRGCYNEAMITEERIGQLEAENTTGRQEGATWAPSDAGRGPR